MLVLISRPRATKQSKHDRAAGVGGSRTACKRESWSGVWGCFVLVPRQSGKRQRTYCIFTSLRGPSTLPPTRTRSTRAALEYQTRELPFNVVSQVFCTDRPRSTPPTSLVCSSFFFSPFSPAHSLCWLQVLLPLNEPTFGTAKKSQIQTFLEQNDGPGLQHIVRA